MNDEDLKMLFYDSLERFYRDLFVANYNRLTVFTLNPQDLNIITPFVRFRPHADGILEVKKSKAQFERGQGYAGVAWNKPHDYIAAPFPEFHSREALEDYYRSQLLITGGITASISHYMEKVRWIFCYGFLDREGDCNGVLCIDCLDPPVESKEGRIQLFRDKSILDRGLASLEVIFDSCRILLNSK